MPNFRIALGYTTESRRQSAPVVLAAGSDQAKLQAAVDAAGPEFVRFEFGIFTFTRKAKRNSNTHALAAGGGENHDNPPPAASSEEAPASAADANQPPSGASAEDDEEEPTLGVPSKPGKPSRR